MRKVIIKLGYRLYMSIFAHKCWYKLNLYLYHLIIRGLGMSNSKNEKLS